MNNNVNVKTEMARNMTTYMYITDTENVDTEFVYNGPVNFDSDY